MLRGMNPNAPFTALMASQALPAFDAGQAAPDWVHLLPAPVGGKIGTTDSRGPYHVTDTAALIAASFAEADRLPIDENHSTDLAAPRGEPAPARGWIVGMEARADGIWGQVEWNAAGADLAGLTVNGSGALIATFSDGTNQTIGKVALAAFIAPTGLKQVGSSNWEATWISGAAKYGQPGTAQYGRLLSGALERSNVDIAEELVNLITAQRNFQANAKAIDTATQISQTIINLRS